MKEEKEDSIKLNEFVTIFYKNEKVFIKFSEKISKKLFLEWLEFILDYYDLYKDSRSFSEYIEFNIPKNNESDFILFLIKNKNRIYNEYLLKCISDYDIA